MSSESLGGRYKSYEVFAVFRHFVNLVSLPADVRVPFSHRLSHLSGCVRSLLALQVSLFNFLLPSRQPLDLQTLGFSFNVEDCMHDTLPAS